MCDYYVTDGNQYISTRNGIHTTANIKEATISNISKASNILKMIPKSLSKISEWTILPVPESESSIYQDEIIDSNYSFIKLDTIVNDMMELTETAENYAKYAKTINKQLSEVELEIEDLYHYIEFSSFNAAQGYKAYKMLKERLIKRRELKDSIVVLDSVQEKNMLTCSRDNIDNVVNKLESRSYRPRVLQELFN